MSTISFVVAMDRNRTIGRDNRLPWHMPADMKRFRQLTMGKAVLMGRKTYESIGKPLAGRHNIVLTRDKQYVAEGCTVANSIDEALQAAGEGELMVIGGGLLYEQMLAAAERIYLTLIDGQFEGDTKFPPIDLNRWREVSRELCPADGDNAYDYAFIELERREPKQ